MTGEQQYLALCERILSEGVWVENERTGKRCLTIINADMTYHADHGLPLLTSKKTLWKAAIAEKIGYIRGYDNAESFRKLGTPTWNMNANETKAWLENPVRKGTDDMGRVYGVQGRGWVDQYQREHDQLANVYSDLKKGIDNRGEILTYWNHGEFDKGCLRPCLHSYQFSILDGKLYVNATQRSCDIPLGIPFNMVQCYFFGKLMAQITGLEFGAVYHKMVNVHIYEDQIDPLMEQLSRKEDTFAPPQLKINPEIRTLHDVESWVTLDDFEVIGYQHHPFIKFPFSA